MPDRWRSLRDEPPGREVDRLLAFSRRTAELECFPGHPVEIWDRPSFDGPLARSLRFTHWTVLPTPPRRGSGPWTALARQLPPAGTQPVLLYHPRRLKGILDLCVSNPEYVRRGNAARDGYTHWHPIPPYPERIGPKTRPCAFCRGRNGAARKAARPPAAT